MNDKFDELTKSMAQSVTRRGALKRFGVGLAGVVLAALGLTNKAEAGGCVARYKKICTGLGLKRGTPEWDLCVSNGSANCY